MRLGSLISGRGSNFETVQTAIAERRLAAEVPAVVSNHTDPSLQRAMRTDAAASRRRGSDR